MPLSNHSNTLHFDSTQCSDILLSHPRTHSHSHSHSRSRSPFSVPYSERSRRVILTLTLPLVLVLVLLPRSSHAQSYDDWSYIPDYPSTTFQGKLLSTVDNPVLFLGSTYYDNLDSGHVFLARGPELSAFTDVNQFSMFGLPLMYDAITLPDGYLLAGKRTQTIDYAYLAKFNNNFELEWLKGPDDTDFWTLQIQHLEYNNGQIHAFASSNPGDDQLQKFKLESDGSSWSVIESTTAQVSQARIFNAAPTDTPEEFFCIGQVRDGVTGEYDMAVFHYEENGISNAFKITFEESSFESGSGIYRTSDGGYIFSFTQFGINAFANGTIVFKMDDQQNILWSRKITRLETGIQLGSALETQTGDLLFVGLESADFATSIVKLDASGNTIWAKRIPASLDIAAGVNDIIQLDDGSFQMLRGGDHLQIVELTQEGESCLFEESLPITNETISLTVDSIQFNDSNFAVENFDLNPMPRTLDLTLDQGCSFTDNITDFVPHELSLHPNPAVNELWIDGLPFEWISFEVFTSDGRLELSGQLTDRLNTTELEPGLKVLSLQTSKGIHRMRFVKQ